MSKLNFMILEPLETGKHYHDKEVIDFYSGVSVIDGVIHENVRVKLYKGRSRNSSVIYATVWLKNEQYDMRGSGRASGGNYHKPSAAITDAIVSCGVRVSRELTNDYDIIWAVEELTKILSGSDTVRVISQV